MARDLSPTLLEILRSALAEVERALELPTSDPGLRGLKQAIVLAISELELRRGAGADLPDETGQQAPRE